MTLPSKPGPAIPRSLIPDEDHITTASAVLPPQSLEEESVYDTNRQEWVTKVFPSVAPAGEWLPRLPLAGGLAPSPPLAHAARSACLEQGGETWNCWSSG